MLIKFKDNTIKLTHEQLQELAIATTEPDMGWESMVSSNRAHKTGLVEHQGEYGTYVMRVNVSIGIIKVLEVK